MAPSGTQPLGSRDPFSQNGRGLSLLEFLDWVISMAAGVACALLLYQHGKPQSPWGAPQVHAYLVLTTTVVVGVIDLLNKRTRLRLNLPASPGMTLFGTGLTMAVFAAVGALFYYQGDVPAFFLLIFMFSLTCAEMRELRKRSDAASHGAPTGPDPR